MTESTLVSIVTIVFNGEKHLQQTINSVKNQTYKHIEYIIVDGGSSDNTVNIIKDNLASIDHWISEKDNGISDAFNKGIKLCHGEIIGLLNSDDWLERNAVELVVNHIKEYDIAYGESLFWLNDKPLKKTNGDHSKLRMGMTVSHPASFVKRVVYETYGLFKTDYRIAMDYELFLRFSHKGVRFKKINAILTNMRKGGVSDVGWLSAIKEEIKIKNEYYNRITTGYYFLRQFIIFTLKDFLGKFNYHT